MAGYSKRTYERVSAMVLDYVDQKSKRLLLMLGEEPPFTERKTPAERFNEYTEAADAGTLEGSLVPGLSRTEEDVQRQRMDIDRLMRRFAGEREEDATS